MSLNIYYYCFNEKNKNFVVLFDNLSIFFSQTLHLDITIVQSTYFLCCTICFTMLPFCKMHL